MTFFNLQKRGMTRLAPFFTGLEERRRDRPVHWKDCR
jgi:hypothetical protein